MRRILITNDDGISADGIIRLARCAKEYGEVWVVAPDSERSAASHSITLRTHIDLFPHDFPVSGVRAYSCSGTPADCVRVGGLALMPEKPDVLLSGINYGYNAATDTQYSATVGAALEGAFQGIHSIALSEAAVPCHEVTDAYLGDILEKWIDGRLPWDRIVNVNFPGCPLSECKGILEGLKTARGGFYRDRYKEKEKLPGGGVRLKGDGIYSEDADEGTDLRALVDKYVSVSILCNVRGFSAASVL